MRRWVWTGVVGAVIYFLVAAVVYQRELRSYTLEETAAAYRLGDAEEIRREIAQQIQFATHKANDYASDPDYIEAQSKVDAAVAAFPDSARLTDIRAAEIRYGVWAVAVYLVVLGIVAAGRRTPRDNGMSSMG